MKRWLEECSEEDGRTVTQTVRWIVQLTMDNGLPQEESH